MTIALDTPIHPAVVHFPVAFFTGAWILLIAGALLKNERLRQAAFYVYIMAAFSTLLAVPTGLGEADRLNLHHPVLFWHRNCAIAATVLAWSSLLIIWFVRKKSPARANLVFAWASWICVGLVLAAGYLGGEMVFHYGIGVSS